MIFRRTQVFISNANQYFVALKKNIELEEEWKPNKTNNSRHKERRLLKTPSNINRAKKYLEYLKGNIKSYESEESKY